jgi:hypothetical protein
VGVCITVLCAVRDRSENLKIALESWIALNQITRIVIVDWGSSEPVSEIPRIVELAHVKVVRRETDEWHLAAALNVGLAEISDGWVLKLDADHSLNNTFFSRVRKEPRTFYRGYWAAHLPKNAGLNGLCLVETKNLKAVGGWDERIRTYGWEDSDLYLRLNGRGLHERWVPSGAATHLRHPKTKNRPHGQLPNKISTEINRRATEARPVWPLNNTGEPRLGPIVDPDSLNEFLRARASVRNNRLLVQMVGEWLTRVVVATRVAWRKARTTIGLREEKNLVLVATHGLGNRLRAIASAQALCAEKGWKLTVVWLKDDHMRADLCDLIEFEGEVISDPSYLLDLAARANVKFQDFVGNLPKLAIVHFPAFRDVHVVRSSRALHNKPSRGEAWKAVLRRYIVRPESEKISAELGIGPFDLGVHVRSGASLLSADATFEKRLQNWTEMDAARLRNERSHTGPEAFLVHLRKREAALSLLPGRHALVSADVPRAATEVGEYLIELGWKVTYGHDGSDRSLNGVVQALGEALALSRSGFFIGSRYSAYTDLVFAWRGSGEGSVVGTA